MTPELRLHPILHAGGEPGWRRWVTGRGGALCLVGVVIAVFAGALGGGFHYDDEHTIVDNPHIRSLAAVPGCLADPGCFSAMPEARMYRPLLTLSYALNYAAGGLQPRGWLLTNLLLHLTVSLALWRLLVVLLADPVAALLASLAFAVHPMVSEPVNYVSARSASLAALFVVLGARALVTATRRPARQTALWLAGAQLAALAGKESGAVLAGLAVVWWLGQAPPPHPPSKGWFGAAKGAARATWQTGGWALAVPAAVVAVWMTATLALVAKAIVTPVRPWPVQAATQSKAVAFYLWRALMPVHLSVEPQFRVAASWWPPVGVVALLLAASLLAVAWRHRRRHRVLWFGAGWFFVALLPTLVIPLNVLVNDNRLYLALVGAAVALGGALDRPGQRWGWWVALLVVAALLAGQRQQVWRSDETLWRDAAVHGPLMPRPQVNLGKALLAAGAVEAAAAASEQAIGLDPASATAHYNLGTAHLRLGRPELAEADFVRALELQPDLVPAWHNLGTARQEQGRPQAALSAYREALARQVSPAGLHNLGAAWLALGQADSALAAFEAALQLEPDLLAARRGRIKALLAKGQAARAAQDAAAALTQWPGDAELGQLAGDAAGARGDAQAAVRAYLTAGRDTVTALLLAGDQARRRGDAAAALPLYREATRRAPGRSTAQGALGELLLDQGRYDEALVALRQAARLAPDDASAYLALARLFLARSRPLEAAAAAERAVALAPGAATARALLAESLRRSGRLEAALAAYRDAVQQAPDEAVLHHNLAHLLEETGQSQPAEASYRTALRLDPDLVEAWFSLGHLLLARDAWDSAAEAFSQVLRRAPDRADAHLNLATARLGQGRRAEAAAGYRRFLALHPTADALRRRVEAQLAALGDAGER